MLPGCLCFQHKYTGVERKGQSKSGGKTDSAKKEEKEKEKNSNSEERRGCTNTYPVVYLIVNIPCLLAKCCLSFIFAHHLIFVAAAARKT